MEPVMHGIFAEDKIIVERTDKAVQKCNTHCYGTVGKRQITLSLYEGLFLMEKEWLAINDRKGSRYDSSRFVNKALKSDKKFLTNYAVYEDMRSRGYIVKTALKFGAAFRIYDRGIKPGQDHAKWILMPVAEKDNFKWHEFSAKNRVAHSTRKKLLVGIVDDENRITYYEVGWTKP